MTRSREGEELPPKAIPWEDLMSSYRARADDAGRYDAPIAALTDLASRLMDECERLNSRHDQLRSHCDALSDRCDRLERARADDVSAIAGNLEPGPPSEMLAELHDYDGDWPLEPGEPEKGEH